MPILVTKSQITALAKSLDVPNAGYLHKLDIIAKAFGFENQAAMMAVLKDDPRSSKKKAAEPKEEESWTTSLSRIGLTSEPDDETEEQVRILKKRLRVAIEKHEALSLAQMLDIDGESVDERELELFSKYKSYVKAETDRVTAKSNIEAAALVIIEKLNDLLPNDGRYAPFRVNGGLSKFAKSLARS